MSFFYTVKVSAHSLEQQKKEYEKAVKNILKIRLAGKTKIVRNLSQAFITISQQSLGIFQLTADNVCPYINSKFFFKMLHGVGTAAMNLFCDIFNT